MGTETLLATDIDPDVYARRWRILPVLCLSLMIIMISNGSLNVALPALAHDLDASASALQWMVDAYALVFAGLLFTAGTIGDRFGRKGTLEAGLSLFLVGTAVATQAQSAGMVIGARAIMGLAAALVMPSTLSILTNVFPAEERGRAISTWAGVAAGGAALGPSMSGFLLTHFWWGSVFLVNVPLVVLALVAGIRRLPSSKDPVARPFDIAGAALSIVAIGTLVYAIIEAPAHGWATRATLGTFAASVVAFGLFALRERTARHPMLDLRLFRDRRFSVASAGMAMAFFAVFGTFFIVTQYLQLVLGFSPLAAGVALLPPSLLLMVLSPQAPRLVAGFGAARVVSAGLAVGGIGLLVLSRVGVHSTVAVVGTAFMLLVSGMALTMTPLTTLIMSSVPPGQAGVGSAMNDTTRELGGALGVAMLGSLVATRFTSSLAPTIVGLPAEAQDAASTGLAGALGAAARLGGTVGSDLANAAKAAFVHGVAGAAVVGAGVLLATAAAAYFLIPDDRRTTSMNPAPSGRRTRPVGEQWSEPLASAVTAGRRSLREGRRRDRRDAPAVATAGPRGSGRAEAVPGPVPVPVIRIHPDHVESWGLNRADGATAEGAGR